MQLWYYLYMISIWISYFFEEGSNFMNDYQEMYLHMFRAVEKAVRLLQQAQTECEALYISKESPAPALFIAKAAMKEKK